MRDKKSKSEMKKTISGGSINNITKNLKCYFMIVNLVLAVVAFSGFVAGQGNCPDGICPSDIPQEITTGPGVGNSAIVVDDTPTNTNNPAGVSAVSGQINTATQQLDRDPIVRTGDGIVPGDTESPASAPPANSVEIQQPPKDGATTGQTGLFGGLFNFNLQSMLTKGAIGAGIFGTIGALAGGDNGAQWGALSGAIGGVVAALTEKSLGPFKSTLLGLGVATLIFILTYKKASTEITEFLCLPWQAPVGGQDCELCNEFEECSEYTCKSLGQACEIINQGTEEQSCVWVNPHDVNSPIIEFTEVSRDHLFRPDGQVRPPSRGVEIKPNDDECIRAFFPLEFKFKTNEPAQCKIDYNLTTNFEDMSFYVNGDSLFNYNHTEKLSLPGPDALNAENPELKNDGEYRLLIRCQDANGNFNQDAYFVSFCVEKGPDTTPPVIVDVNIPSGNPVQFNQSSFNLEVYVNEPSECKWSRTDQSFDNMEQEMDCATRVFQMNNQNLYTCKTTLSGIQDRVDNEYFFRCKDKPNAAAGDRNVNTQSYLYNLIGTQPLNILGTGPNETIRGATDVVPVFLQVKTDNGFENGESLCYYYNDNLNNPPVREEDYVLFHETKASEHIQRQDLVQGSYVYYFKCVDLGGNAAYTSTQFKVETDRSAPKIIRVYKETELKIITDEQAECTYSNQDCNYEIETGIEMSSFDNQIHTAEWILNKNYYVRCKDQYDNQPFPNTCSIIVRPSQTTEKDNSVLDFGF